MQLLISDTNILIDLEEGKIINQMFQLPFAFSVPDILFEEELEERHNHLIDLGLELGVLSGESLTSAMRYMGDYKRASRNDCFALALANQEDCTLLTGDGALRAAAVHEGVNVHGTIWLVNEMVKEKIITKDQARRAYECMKDTGRRLPWATAERQLEEIVVD